MKTERTKNWIISLLLTIGLVYMAMPLYMPAGTKLNLANDKAQIAVYNDGFQNNSVKLLSKVDNSVFGECKKNGTACAGYSITENITNKWKRHKIKFEALGDGIVYVDLRGVQVTDNNEIKHAMPVDYRNFTVNGEKIFEDAKTHSYYNTFQYSLSVKNGSIISIEIEIRNHLPKLSQVKKLTFLSILILAFLLSYKLVQYAAKFKILENNSRIDIVFVAVFALLLFVPMSHISNAEKSLQENRMLAKYPQFVQENGINEAFGEQFNSWFNDRFFGRDFYTYLYNYIKFYIEPQGSVEKAIIGKNGFIYSKMYKAADIYTNNNLFSKEELELCGRNISNFVNNAKRQGIKQVYFMLSNDKESIYPEYYPSYIKRVNNISRLDQLVNYIHTNYPEIRFCNFKDKLLKLKRSEIIFYKTDSHLNDIGVYYEYYFLMSQIKKDFPDIKILSLDDFDIKYDYDERLNIDTYKHFPVLPKYEKSNFRNKFLTLKKDKNVASVHISETIKQYESFSIGVNSSIQNGLRVFTMGDSFLDKYYRYLLESFSEVDKMLYSSGFYFVLTPDIQDYMKNHIPDILIVESAERFLYRFLNLEFPNLQ